MPKSTGSSSATTSWNWSENASWRTRFSSLDDDEFDYPASVNGDSDYAWGNHDLRSCRSISSWSVMTAEPIDFDCSKEAGAGMFF